MNREDFDEFKKKLNIEEFSHFYYYHGDKATVEKYGISYGNFYELKREYNIKIPSDISASKKKKTWQDKASNKTGNLCIRVPKDELFQYYEIENHSYEETKEHFDITHVELQRLISIYDIHKSKEAHTAQIKKSKLERYGDENFNNRLKCKNTLVERYGVANVSQLDSTLEKMRETWRGHGFDHPMHVDEYKQKVIDKLAETNRLYNNNSSCNKKFEQLLIDNNIEYEKEVVIGSFRYDFKVGDNLIEINPFPFHNVTWSPFGEVRIDKQYHQNKSLNALKNNFRCIHVWDWDDPCKIISLLLPRETTYARKCVIKEVDKQSAKDFISEYHLQGYAKDNIRLGLYYGDELISIMTFDKPRYNKNYQYELIRYCSSKKVTGGAEKLFRHFLKTYKPETVISYCDYSKFTGDTYGKLGFTLNNISISKHWYNIKTGRHITDNFLRARGFDQLFGTDYGKGTSNKELMLKAGFVEIYDAGQAVYVYER